MLSQFYFSLYQVKVKNIQHLQRLSTSPNTSRRMQQVTTVVNAREALPEHRNVATKVKNVSISGLSLACWLQLKA